MGAAWGPHGSLLVPHGASWEALRAILGPTWAVLGWSWGHLRGCLGRISDCISGVLLRAPRDAVRDAPLGGLLGSTWGLLGASLVPLGACWRRTKDAYNYMHLFVALLGLPWSAWGPTGGALGLWLRFFLLGGENEGMAPEHPSILMDAGALPGAVAAYF